MENAIYATLTRQAGLMAQMQVVANNIANLSTVGFKAEGVTFTEYVRRTGTGESLSMAAAHGRETALAQGPLERTGGSFDLAIEGEGFFLVETPQGPRLTRAGAFTPDAAGNLVTAQGYRLLDAGGAPVFVPLAEGPVGIAADGTISAGGRPVGQIGLVVPRDPLALRREAGTLFSAPQTDPAPAGRILQGFLEKSNVDPVMEVARLIAVSRAYEAGQAFLDREDERIRKTIQAIQTR
ncbi:flagellar basal-body rod protein FlgF [Rubellimicrobium thermophilum DSM 16684]|uniref:Flagellar basal-body rod protein FlgF n=1 Tax=Rubellimicrobium thermophilum DSM 16684 TaxID=1123069 RepID=S9QX23_9RHOB|nr:flagellar hook-basal body complex protein [Rubellimicrobium thermophilum]EPX84158.1 flagellar basal-body rod protein FlgF [Rubellimicrobium thermophilum DSM 16684]